MLQTYETETKQLREHALAEETLKKLFDDLFKATQQLEKLDAQQGFFEKREKELHDFQAALLHIKPILDKQSERLTEQKTTSRELVNVQQNLQKITLDFDHSANSYNTLRPQYEQRDKLKIQEKELNKILNINELVAEIEKNRAKIKLDKEKLATLKLTIDKDKQERIDCQIQLEKDQAQMPNSERLLAVQSWFDTHKKLKDDKANIMAEAHKVKHEESELNTQKTKWLDTELIAADSIQTDSNLAQIEVVFENQRQVFLSKAEQLDSQKIKLQTRLAIQAHAATLTDGQPCPMCGSVHHPEPLSDDQDLKKDIKTIENQQVEFKKNAESLSKIVNEIGKIAAKFEGLNKQKEDIRVRYNLTVANLTQHESEFIWEDFQKENPQGIAEAFQQINILKAQIDNQQKRIKTLEQSIAQAETKQRDEFELPLERLSTTTENKAEEQQKLRAEITLFDYETEANQGLETLNKKIQNLDYQYIEVEKQYLSIEIKYNKLKAETQTEAARLGMLQTADSKHKLALEAITLELTTALAQTHFENLTNAQLILTKNLVLASEQKAISDFKADFAQAQKQYLSLREQSKEHVFEENKLLEINKLISENEKAMKAFIQQQGALKNELESIEKDLAKQADLYKKKDALNLRAADLKTLQEMFRANGFVNFISTVYLQNLCNHADERFHLMTRQQLRLELSDKNEFMIRDLLNGGKTRSASSLSGGQKFQASLALALALADSIQKSGQKNFFFLDEGFGSLDKEALKIVFETLKSLRKENRIVGLISHVEELQHEMDRCLHINNDEQLGSLVSVF